MEKLFLADYFKNFDEEKVLFFVNSSENLKFLNENLNFFYNLGFKDENLIKFLEKLLNILLEKKKVENVLQLNKVETDFVSIYCKVLTKFVSINCVSSLILLNEIIDIEKRINFFQNLIEDELINDNDNEFCINFLFINLKYLFDSYSYDNQKKNKLINILIHIIFIFLEKNFDFIFVNLKKLIDNCDFESKDDKSIETNLDLISSLIYYMNKESKKNCSEKSNLKNLEKIKNLILNDKSCQYYYNSVLNKLSSSIRKKSRFILNELNLLPIDGLEILETLEEKQIHLVQPIIDKKLNCNILKQFKLKDKNLNTAIELIIKRMFDHDSKLVKRYAIKFLENEFNLNQKIDFLTETFVLNQIIFALQDNQIYNEDFNENSLNFLNFFSSTKILKKLVELNEYSSPFGYYFILKQLSSNILNKKKTINCCENNLTVIEIQKLFMTNQKICFEPVVRSAIQIYLLCILTDELNFDELNSLEFYFYTLSSIKIKEIKVCSINFLENLQQTNTNLMKLNFENEKILIGFSRSIAIKYNLFLKNKDFDLKIFLNEIFLFIKEKLNEEQKFIFLKEYLVNIIYLDLTLDLNFHNNFFINEIDFNKNLLLLELICKKKLEQSTYNKLKDFLLKKTLFESNDQESYICCLIDLIKNNQSYDDDLKSTLVKILNSFLKDQTNLKVENLKHWRCILKYLKLNKDFDILNILSFYGYKNVSNEMKKEDLNLNEFLLSLIPKTPVDFNRYLIKFFGYLLNKEIIDENVTIISNNFFKYTNLLFNTCLELKKKEYYKKTFQVFIEKFAFSKLLFSSKKQILNDENKEQLFDLFDQVFAIETLEVKSVLINHLCCLLNENKNILDNELLKNFFMLNLEIGLLFDKKVLSFMDYLKLEISSNKLVINSLNFSFVNDFQILTRLNALKISSFLSLENIKLLVDNLILKEQKIIEDKSSKNFPNSPSHRSQTKVWQFFAFLVLNLKKKENCSIIQNIIKKIYNHSINSIMKQTSGQLSVKILQQFIIIVLLIDEQFSKLFYDSFLDILHFESKNNFLLSLPDKINSELNRIGFFTSFLSIVFHLIKRKPELKFFPISCLLSCHQYKVRLFSHLILLDQNIKIGIDFNEEKINLLPVPRGAANFSKNLEKLKQDWFYTLFDIEKDFNLLFIFKLLPKLTSVCSDDYINLNLLEKFFDSLPLNNEESKLFNAYETTVFNKILSDKKNIFNDSEEQCLDKVKEVFQKKYIGPQLNLELSSEKKNLNDLIICASLLDRAPNLGGLCRTSEIFGIKKLLIPNELIVKEKDFLQLSVSSEKWVNIEEVNVYQLVDYLKKLKKNFDYTLVGVEQSTESVCLTKFKFPEKTLLLLGNEKEGLPMELLKIMDYCVEIPQAGVIRSLNVHVTGAIVAWEYFKQHRK